MTSFAPSGRRTFRSSSGRLAFAPAPDRRSIKDREAANVANACDQPGCGRARHALHRFCVEHYRRYQLTGHPTGLTVIRKTWAPYFAEASAFVDEQLRAGHPGVEAAGQWCAEQFFGNTVVHRNSRKAHMGYLWALGRARRNGIEPTDLCARWIAAYLADDRGESARPLFKDDSHFRHQAARMFLYAKPLSRAPRWHARRRVENRTPEDAEAAHGMPRWNVREYTFRRVNDSIGLLAMKAANEIKRREADRLNPHRQSKPVEGSSVPFLDSLFTLGGLSDR